VTGPGRESGPDIEIAANVLADELRFLARPSVEVSFSNPGPSAQETARENIDSPVEPGKAYRRVRVTTRISGRL
jgi:hypothetical protein